MGSLICGTAIPWRRYVSVPRSVGAVNLWNFKKQNTYQFLDKVACKYTLKYHTCIILYHADTAHGWYKWLTDPLG